MCLCETKYQGRGIAQFLGSANLPSKYRAVWGIAGIVSQCRAIWGHEDFRGFGGIRAKRENSGNSVEFNGVLYGNYYTHSMNSVAIPGKFRSNEGFSGKSRLGVVSGDLGPRKAFAQIARVDLSISLKTLTSLNKEVRPFFLSDNSISRIPSVSSLLQHLEVLKAILALRS